MADIDLTPGGSDLWQWAFVIYRPIADCDGYVIGTDGSIWSRRLRGRHDHRLSSTWTRMKAQRRPYGNRYVNIGLRPTPGGKLTIKYVHRLVLEAFMGPAPPGMLGCHNNGDTGDNRIGNLRWDTMVGNMADRIAHGTNGVALDYERVVEIRSLLRGGMSMAAVARMFGVNVGSINRIDKGKTWVGVGAHERNRRETGG